MACNHLDPSYTNAKASVLRWLSRREYAQSELKLKLQQHGIAKEIIETILFEATEQGWQSELRYAEMFVRAKRMRYYGPKRIVYDLQQKGLTDDLISRVMQAYDEEAWINLAQDYSRKQAFHLQSQEFNEKAKWMRKLEQRGYTHEQIKAAWAALTELK